MKTYHVAIVPQPVAERVRDRLVADGFRLGAAPYAQYELAAADVKVVYYPKRAKLLVQGNGTEGVLRRIGDLLGPAATAAAAPARPEARVDEPTIGSDESGKGDYFGSLVVAACRLEPDDVAFVRRLGVRDSKEATTPQVLAAEGAILDRFPVAVVEHEPEEYNRLHAECGNVNVILGRAHARAIRELLARGGCKRVVVDRFGGEHYVKGALGAAAAGITLTQVPRAEANPAVAAASFVARARFLRSLDRMSDACGVDLVPGSSPPAERCARKVYAVGGTALLAKVAKMHFRTTQRIVGA